MSDLLTTKLKRPALPKKRVQRASLMAHLDNGLESGHQVILVSAPAGFGKTVCVSEWVDSLDRWPTAWLSLDAADDDPGRFFTYLIAALQEIDAGIGGEIEGVLRAGQLPPVEIFSTTLIGDILRVENRFLLVLDDFQVIQDAYILHVLEDLISNLPPAFHLVLITREDPSLPLARLRANDKLSEIRAGDLRFSEKEADQFLNQSMELSLSTSDIRKLVDRTEGWIAGLHLAGLSIRDRENPSEFIANLSGSQRFILSYLTEEVLSRQPPEIQRFLVETSVLERLTGDLCDAVTGRKDSRALLEDLFSANLFLIPLDDRRHWYRYHALFADLLHDRLQDFDQESVAGLHQRASRWYARMDMPSEAIEHALAASDYAVAVRLIENHAMDMLMKWHIKTVDGWLQAIPQAWCAQSAEANLAFAWMYIQRGAYSLAAPYLSRLNELQSEGNFGDDDPILQAKWLALQIMLLNAQGKPAESLQLANRALALVLQDDGRVRSMIDLGLAGAYQQLDDYDNALKAFQRIIQYGETVGNSVYELLGISGLALMAIQHGQLHFTFEIVSRGIERMDRSGSLPPISTAVYGELGVVHYQWHQLEKAFEYFQRAIRVSELSGYSDAKVYYGVVLSRLHQLEGDLEAADQQIQSVSGLMRAEAPTVVREEALAQEIRIHLARNRLANAEAILAPLGFSFQDGFSYPEQEPARIVTPPTGALYTSAFRILLYRARTKQEMANLKTGIALADRIVEESMRRRYLLLGLELLLLRSQMHAAAGDIEKSTADTSRALELAEPEDFISIFIDEGTPLMEMLRTLLARGETGNASAAYVERIVAAFPESRGVEAADKPTAAQSVLVDPLSEREMEVLALIGEGLSNQEIAERLAITLHTVKKHTSNIYGKLGVNSRTQALARARQLGLF
ncbi:MAG: LuxR C-terminal-related transcriptional regulator [Anaerolineales bacterium]|jgi:LuxR family maltose regulon positive regulatory protein